LENIKSAFETAAIAAIEPFKEEIKAVLDFIARTINAFSNLPEPVRKVIVIIALLLFIIGPLLMILGTVLPNVLGGATRSLNPFSGGIIGLIFNFVKLVAAAAIVVKVLTFLGISTGPVGAAVLGLNGAIAGTATSIWAALVPAIGALVTALLPILAIIASIILIAGILAVAWVTDFMYMRSGIITFVSVSRSLWRAFTAFLRGDTDAAMEHLTEAFDTFGAHVNKVFEKVFGIKDAWGKFMEFMRDALGSVVSYISDVFTQTNWQQLGQYITLGIANGLLMGIPSLIASALAAADAALDTIKARLGISSPSKAFEQLGRFSAQGYQLGLARAMSAEDIARTMARPVNQLSNSQQQNLTVQMASGVTLQQMRNEISANNEQLMNTFVDFLGA